MYFLAMGASCFCGSIPQAGARIKICVVDHYYRGAKYVEETIKLLPERPEPVLVERIFSKIVGIGRIHAPPANPVPA
jgi:hypothetical protein